MSRASADDSFARKVSSAVRGSGALREDIADEIADHLASHVEEHPAETADDAIRAFGDPKAVARELRRVHLGGQIMLQRILVAVLVVIVLALGANAWFSWRTAHQQSAQFAEMNDRLGSLVALQQAGQPEPPPYDFNVFFFTGPPDEPAKHYEARFRVMGKADDASFSGTLIADADGRINLAAKMQPGRDYMLSGSLLPAGTALDADQSYWSRVIRLPKPDEPKELRINVGPRHEYTVNLALPPGITWDHQKMRRAEVKFYQSYGRYISRDDDRAHEHTSQSRTYEFELEKPNTVSCLLPGPTTAWIQFIIEPGDIDKGALLPLPVGDRASPRPAPRTTPPTAGGGNSQAIGIRCNIRDFAIPEAGGTIAIEIAPPQDSQATGIIFDGTVDKPLADMNVSLLFWSDRGEMPQYLEFLRTDSRGGFAALSRAGNDQAVAFDWESDKWGPVRVHWPLSQSFADAYVIADGGTRFQLDVSRLAAARLNVTGMDELLQGNRRLICPLRIGPVLRIMQRSPRGSSNAQTNCWSQDLDPADASGARLVVPAGEYGVNVELCLAEWKDTVPGLEQWHRYRRYFEFEVGAGGTVDVTVPVDGLDKWQLVNSEWHEGGKKTPSTMPSAQAAAAE